MYALQLQRAVTNPFTPHSLSQIHPPQPRQQTAWIGSGRTPHSASTSTAGAQPPGRYGAPPRHDGSHSTSLHLPSDLPAIPGSHQRDGLPAIASIGATCITSAVPFLVPYSTITRGHHCPLPPLSFAPFDVPQSCGGSTPVLTRRLGGSVRHRPGPRAQGAFAGRGSALCQPCQLCGVRRGSLTARCRGFELRSALTLPLGPRGERR